jgi:hypothetical protein
MTWQTRAGDRRAHQRFEIYGRLPATLETNEEFRIRDSSSGGVRFECSRPLAADSVHKVLLEFRSQIAVAEIRVRHCQLSVEPGVFLIGAELVNPDAATLDQIQQWTADAASAERNGRRV